MIHGIDGGNNLMKAINVYGATQIVSCLGEWRERKLVSNFGKDDIEFEYQGQKGFAGTLAKYESEFPREMMGDSKAHDDAKLRILITLHQVSNSTHNKIVVGQPISKHNDNEKKKIKEMLQGWHTITVNGIEKTFCIDRVEVAAEGASIFFASEVSDTLVRIIDIGSGTVNLATIMDGRFIDKDSSTLTFGANSNKTNDIQSMIDGIIAKTSQKWNRNDCVLVGGGVAKESIRYLQSHFNNIQVVEPRLQTHEGIKILHPVYANAVGFYNIARMIFNGQ